MELTESGVSQFLKAKTDYEAVGSLKMIVYQNVSFTNLSKPAFFSDHFLSSAVNAYLIIKMDKTLKIPLVLSTC